MIKELRPQQKDQDCCQLLRFIIPDDSRIAMDGGFIGGYQAGMQGGELILFYLKIDIAAGRAGQPVTAALFSSHHRDVRAELRRA